MALFLALPLEISRLCLASSDLLHELLTELPKAGRILASRTFRSVSSAWCHAGWWECSEKRCVIESCFNVPVDSIEVFSFGRTATP